jgi:hypothetical protein
VEKFYHNAASRILLTYVGNNDYSVLTLDTLIHFPDNHCLNPDVLDITLLKIPNLRHSIQNLDDLSSDHNPLLMVIKNQTRKFRPMFN